jgi:hypothetical protein
VKYGVDLAIARGFKQDWNPFMYLSPRVSPLLSPETPRAFVIALLIATVPFAWMGLSLTVRRLRDAGLSPFWAGLFFLPFLHFAFFAAMAIVPTAKQEEKPPVPDAGPFRDRHGAPLAQPVPPRLMTRIIPRSTTMAFLLGLSLSLSLGIVSYVVTVQLSKVLGTFMFIGLPFAMGFFPAFCVTWGRKRGAGGAIGYGMASVLISLILLMALGWEGLGCLVMAFPITFGLAALGGLVGWASAKSPMIQNMAPLAMLVALPVLGGAQLMNPPAPSPLSVVSTVRIAAPPSVVWKNVVSFPRIESPPPAVFAIVAMPLEARIDGHDPGATRRCIFTNGTFVEPIEVWDEPRQLTFGVAEQPRHLDEYIHVKKGQFLLEDNHDGTTTLVGTTWYELRVFPAPYWSWWSERLLHAIHMRVLDHIARLSEQRSFASAPMPAWMQSANQTCACTRHAKEGK